MSPTDELVPVLKRLRLSGVLDSLEPRLRQAIDGELSHVEFLLRLFTDEVERRDAKQLRLRIGRAGFDGHKTLEDAERTALGPTRAWTGAESNSHLVVGLAVARLGYVGLESQPPNRGPP